MSLSKKLITIICLFSIALSTAIGIIGYDTYNDSVTKRYQEFADSILRLSLAYIDPYDVIESLESGEKSQTYENTQTVFNLIKVTTGITFLYFFRPHDDTMEYYIYAFTQEEVDELKPGQELVSLGSFDPIPDELREMITASDGEIRNIRSQSGYGYMMGSYFVARDADGNIIGVLASEIDMSDINKTLRDYVITVVLGAIMILSLCLCLTILYIRRKVTLPIEQLSTSANNFANQDTDTELQAIVSNIKTGDEIETLSKSIEKMSADMISYIANLTAVTAEKERIGAELSVATQIQASMLPRVFPKKSEIELFASMEPAKEVGGDFYDFFYVDENTLAVVMADVSGKGVPAALFMVVAKTLIKTNALRGLSPRQVFEISNNLLCENNEADMFVTAFMGYLDIPGGKFTFVNAGHNPPLLKRKTSEVWDWLQSKVGFVLAGMEDMSYTEGEITLESGDEIFLYTDGVTEAHDADNNLFSDPYLLEVANKAEYDSLEKFAVYIKTKIDEFAGETPQADDITMLALRYN